MKSWFNSSELAGLPGMPSSAKGALYKAKRENWKSRKHRGLGGGKDYHISLLPDETRAALAAKALHPKETTRSSRKQPQQIDRLAILDAVRELARLQDKQETLLFESRRLIISIQAAIVAKP